MIEWAVFYAVSPYLSHITTEEVLMKNDTICIVPQFFVFDKPQTFEDFVSLVLIDNVGFPSLPKCLYCGNTM